VLCINHTRTAIFKHLNPLIHNSTRESVVPHTEYTRADEIVHLVHPLPTKMYHRLLLLFGAILKFRCRVHRFVATLTLNARSAGLPC
jgi:hypothetical protein